MKKTQLRKIIRESIKQLMNEQTSNARSHTVHTCPGGASGMIRNLTVDNQVPVVGQYFKCADLGSAGGILNTSTTNFCVVGIEKPQYLVGGQTNVTSLGSGGCPSPNTTTQAGSCNPNAWPNHANWTSTFTNTVTNHNNPCNFLNNKIAQFTAALVGTGGGNYQNMLNCKLNIANQLHSQHNC